MDATPPSLRSRPRCRTVRTRDEHSLTSSSLACRPEVLVTLTQDEGKLIAALHGVKSAGEADLVTGIQVAQVRRDRGFSLDSLSLSSAGQGLMERSGKRHSSP